MATRYLALGALALNLLMNSQASALNVARATKIINTPINTDRPLFQHDELSGHNGFSLDVELSRGNSTTWTNRRSTSHETTVLRYTIAFGAPKRASRECDLSWGQTGKVAATGIVWALSNRLVRGEDDYGGQIPGGATLWGHAIPWLFAASIHDGLTYGQAAGHIAADFASEQIGGWSAALDMGESRNLPEDHWAYNPGSRGEDQIAMTAHLYRARSLSLAMLRHRHGDIDDVALFSPVIGGFGYQAGREWHKSGNAPGQGEKGLVANLIGGQTYHVGELVHGGAYGIGVARTVECSD